MKRILLTILLSINTLLFGTHVESLQSICEWTHEDLRDNAQNVQKAAENDIQGALAECVATGRENVASHLNAALKKRWLRIDTAEVIRQFTCALQKHKKENMPRYCCLLFWRCAKRPNERTADIDTVQQYIENQLASEHAYLKSLIAKQKGCSIN